MKKSLLCLLAASLLLCAASAAAAAETTVENMPPVVVKTVPQSGDTAVDPKLKELEVTFSKKMLTKQMWSFVQISKETFPQKSGEPHYEADEKTIVLPVKLQPGKSYVIWINQGQYNAFRDKGNRPAVPYLLVFETKK